MLKKLTCASLILCLYSQISWAVFAPRPLGMGGAFTAIADDPFAAYWNPAGFAINPGIDISAHYQLNNRNQQIGDKSLALKGCFEIEMNPFAWLFGIGAASMFAYDSSVFLANQGIIKKNWSRPGMTFTKEESMAEAVKEEDEKQVAAGGESIRETVSKTEIAKKALKAIAKGTIQIGEKYAEAAIHEAARQSRHYFFAPYWYQPNYYRPSYWDNRYDYSEKELTPQGKAQFAGAISIMSDKENNSQDTNWYTLSVASGWGEIVALGANLNFYELKIPSANLSGYGAGFDVGGLVRIKDSLMFGLVAKEILTTDIRWNNNTTTRYMMQINTGLAVKPIEQLTVAADIHNALAQSGRPATMHYGVEYRPVYGLALRAGLSDNNKTAGFSLGVGQMIIDYAILGGDYNRTQTVSATWKI